MARVGGLDLVPELRDGDGGGVLGAVLVQGLSAAVGGAGLENFGGERLQNHDPTFVHARQRTHNRERSQTGSNQEACCAA